MSYLKIEFDKEKHNLRLNNCKMQMKSKTFLFKNGTLHEDQKEIDREWKDHYLIQLIQFYKGYKIWISETFTLQLVKEEYFVNYNEAYAAYRKEIEEYE